MKKSTSILWFLASILMIAAGIVCFALPVDTTLTTLAYVIGAIVLVIGVVEIAMFFTTVGLFGGGAFNHDDSRHNHAFQRKRRRRFPALHFRNVVYLRRHFGIVDGDCCGQTQTAVLVGASDNFDI